MYVPLAGRRASAEIGAPLWPRVDPREAGTSRSQAICIHGTCAHHPLLQFPPGGCWQRRDREILFLRSLPPLTSSSIVFIGAPGYIRKCFPFHRFFISPSALAASSSSSRACARVPVPWFWLSRLSAGGCGRRSPSKQGKGASDTRTLPCQMPKG